MTNIQKLADILGRKVEKLPTCWKRVKKIFSLGERWLKRWHKSGSYLSCWLCAFVLLNKECHFIRPGTFNMVSGQKVSLAIPKLTSIYNGLNNISSSSQLDQINIRLSILFVYGWLAHYFKTQSRLMFKSSFELTIRLDGKRLVKISLTI